MNEWKNYDIITYILPFKIEFTIVEKKIICLIIFEYDSL